MQPVGRDDTAGIVHGEQDVSLTINHKNIVIMKRIIFIIASILMLSVGATTLLAQTGNMTVEETGVVIDLTTFTGIVALISAIVTQLLKLVPKIQGSKLAKIGISAGVGILVCFCVWGLKISPLFTGSVWWQVLLYGLAAGLSGCGFYDVIKAIADLFKKSDNDE